MVAEGQINTNVKSTPTEIDQYVAHTCSSLARACGVSYTTASRWLRDGQVSFARAENAAAFVVSRDEIARLRAKSEKQFGTKAALLGGDVAKIQRLVRDLWPVTERRTMIAPPTPKAFAQPTAVNQTS